MKKIDKVSVLTELLEGNLGMRGKDHCRQIIKEDVSKSVK